MPKILLSSDHYYHKEGYGFLALLHELKLRRLVQKFLFDLRFFFKYLLESILNSKTQISLVS